MSYLLKFTQFTQFIYRMCPLKSDESFLTRLSLWPDLGWCCWSTTQTSSDQLVSTLHYLSGAHRYIRGNYLIILLSTAPQSLLPGGSSVTFVISLHSTSTSQSGHPVSQTEGSHSLSALLVVAADFLAVWLAWFVLKHNQSFNCECRRLSALWMDEMRM